MIMGAKETSTIATSVDITFYYVRIYSKATKPESEGIEEDGSLSRNFSVNVHFD